jgi:hypothetical protein
MYKKLNPYDNTLSIFTSIQGDLNKEFEENLTKKKVFLAIDGFIDFLYSLVKTRKSLEKWKQFETIKDFSKRLEQISGSSGNIELILKKKTSGGFAPNNSKALSALGIHVFLLASLGYPKIESIYGELTRNENINATSIGNPGKTIGLEFNDGKLMLSDIQELLEINWELLLQRISKENLIKRIEDSNVIGFGYWSILPQFTDIWQKLREEIFPSIKNINKKLFFVDLADIKKRSKSEIIKMVKILQKLEDQIPVLLSLNDQEAIDLSKVLDTVEKITPNKADFKDFFTAGKEINKHLGLSYLAIHSPHFATISLKNEMQHYWITEAYTSNPSYTVSAGDHFNSGLVAALLGGLSPPKAVLMGNALSAIFVRTGTSPNFGQLRKFIRRYLEYINHDNPHFP